MATCAACAENLPGAAKFCLRCGAPVSDEFEIPPPLVGPGNRGKSMGAGTVVLIVVGVLFGGCFLIGIIAAIVIPNRLSAKYAANETAAIATLRSLASRQAQLQFSGNQDVDGDGIGEYGTFLEMTGAVGLRTGDGGKRGQVLSPPILSKALTDVDARGVVTKSGYAYVIYLPDPSGTMWVHETGPAAAVALTGPVGTDHAETRWCAYAWPVSRGNSGNRCFFVNQDGDVLASKNEVARHSGLSTLPDPDSALKGADGDVWTMTQ